MPAIEQPDVGKLILVRPGTIPIIVSAPHGGRDWIPGVPERKGDGIAKFTTVRDENTAELAEKLAAALEKKLGGRPYLIIARFERTFIDVNRPARDAYEVDAAKPIYDAYHKALADARRDVLKDWGRGLLLDLHGQGAEPEGVFRGTNDGRSVAHLTERLGKPALTGPGRAFSVWRWARKGYTIIPANDVDDKEDRRFQRVATRWCTYGKRGWWRPWTPCSSNWVRRLAADRGPRPDRGGTTWPRRWPCSPGSICPPRSKKRCREMWFRGRLAASLWRVCWYKLLAPEAGGARLNTRLICPPRRTGGPGHCCPHGLAAAPAAAFAGAALEG